MQLRKLLALPPPPHHAPLPPIPGFEPCRTLTFAIPVQRSNQLKWQARVIMKFDPDGTSMINSGNGILIVFHLCKSRANDLRDLIPHT